MKLLKVFVELFYVMQNSDSNFVLNVLLFCSFSYNDECDGYYYYNTKTKVRQWEHPLDAEYKRLVEKARKSSGTGVNDLSDVI